jgi:hypothetical protein
MKHFIFLIFLLLILFVPITIFAQTGLGVQFGGYVVSVLPCTCSASFLVIYIPLYPLAIPHVTNSLTLTPATFRYAYQQFLAIPVPTSWHLGKYAPGVQACLIGVPPGCVPVFNDGAILETGSSFPGHSLF